MTTLTQTELDMKLEEHEVWRTAADVPAVHPDPLKQSDEDKALLEEYRVNGARPFHALEYDLRGLDFQSQSLRLAGLKGSDLRDCNFRNADLRGADLRGCKLEGANFFGATLDISTRIGGIDLGEGLANRSSLITLMEGLGGDAEEEQTNALLLALKRMTR